MNTELEAPRALAAHVQDLLLGDADGSSSMAASLFMVAELLKS
jgi:hypothetical protein